MYGRFMAALLTCGSAGFAACDAAGPNEDNPLKNRIAFESGRTTAGSRIYTMRPDGSDVREFVIGLQGSVSGPDISADGERLAFEHSHDIYTIRWDGRDLRRLTVHPMSDAEPRWAPDGSKLVFTSARSGAGDLYVVSADGSELIRLTNDPRMEGYGVDWSPDGTKIALTVQDSEGPNIYTIDANGENRVQVTSLPGGGSWPSWSPDGSQLAFMGFGTFVGLYKIDADGSDRTLLDPALVNYSPAWSADGKAIAYTRASPLASDGYFGSEEEIVIVASDGTGLVRLTSNSVPDSRPSWGPGD